MEVLEEEITWEPDWGGGRNHIGGEPWRPGFLDRGSHGMSEQCKKLDK